MSNSEFKRKKKLLVEIPEKLHMDIKLTAIKNQVSMNHWVTVVLVAAIKKENNINE